MGLDDDLTRLAGFAKKLPNWNLTKCKLAQKAGFHQLLWTDGKEHKYIEEAGTMNVCFIINFGRRKKINNIFL